MDSIIKAVLDGNWTDLQKHFEKRSAEKVMNKIQDKKVGILSKINGVDIDKMTEIMNISKENKE